MKLIGCGDSWAFGAEIYNPQYHNRENFPPNTDLHKLHFEPKHEAYRKETRYLGVFQKLINAESFVDLTRCAISNDTIVRYLVDYLANEGYFSGKDTSDLFVSIGWTSPERTEFYYKDKWGTDNYIDMGPHVDESAYNKHPHVKEFSRLYYTYFNELGGVFHRHINQIKYLELLLQSLNIKYIMHQAFYHYDVGDFKRLEDTRIKQTATSQMTAADKLMWHRLDNVRFINKDHPKHSTTYNYIRSKVSHAEGFYYWHPSEVGHKIWAEYLFEYCTQKNLLG